MTANNNENNEDYSQTIAVIGGGAAGCVLVRRLLELTDDKTKIMLFERGPKDPATAAEVAARKLSHFPAGLNTSAEWEASASQTGLADRQLWINTASALGGGTVLNAGFYIMGRKDNYDHWPKSKVFTRDNFERAVDEMTKIHRPVVIAKDLMPPETLAGIVERGLKAKFGLPPYQAKNPLLWVDEDGIYPSMGSSKAQDVDQRVTVADSFLTADVCENPRLTIIASTTVTKVFLSEDKTTVTGIECINSPPLTSLFGWKLPRVGNKPITKCLYGFKEVVLSAGAVETPRLLMSSGIGPPDELTASGVDIQVALEEVGKNLWDHALAIFPVELQKGGDENAPPNPKLPPTKTAPDGNTTIRTYDGNGQETKNEKKKTFIYYHGGPNVAYYAPAEVLVPNFANSGWTRKLQVCLLDALRSVIYPPTNPRLGIVAIGLLSPSSRGSVGLGPYSVNPGILSEADDMKAMADAMDDFLEVLRDNNLKVAVPDFSMEPPTREALEKQVAMFTGSYWHMAGSCSGAVNYDSLCVKGISNLRIADASVLPHVIEGNTQAPTMALAYLAAELI